MVAADEDCWDRSRARTGIILMEVGERAVFRGAGHHLQVGPVADGLEVAADDEEVDGVVVFLAGSFKGCVDRVQFAMTLVEVSKLP